ncbi:hypothetical protein VNO77_17047 [Canavalia gladiata]|uniref:Uncharacterized protein n=1 Tax=Canavalia gladiata TaxID=3824 RepID=A0AAN9LI77_CANGL
MYREEKEAKMWVICSKQIATTWSVWISQGTSVIFNSIMVTQTTFFISFGQIPSATYKSRFHDSPRRVTLARR